MFKFLFDTEQGHAKYIIKSLLLALGIAFPMAFILFSLFPNSDTVDADFENMGLYIVIGAPVIETIGMLIIFKVIQVFTNKFNVICISSALVWAALHSLVTPLHGLVIFSTFLIYSIAFKVWEKKSLMTAFSVVVAIHILNNLSAMLISQYS